MSGSVHTRRELGFRNPLFRLAPPPAGVQGRVGAGKRESSSKNHFPRAAFRSALRIHSERTSPDLPIASRTSRASSRRKRTEKFSLNASAFGSRGLPIFAIKRYFPNTISLDAIILSGYTKSRLKLRPSFPETKVPARHWKG